MKRTYNRRAGSYSAIGAVVVAVFAWALRPAGLMLIWPSVALLLVSSSYFGVGPGVYRKRNGRISPAVRWLLAPVLLGHELSRRHYRRKCRAWDEVVPGLLIGGVLNGTEAEKLLATEVTAVLDLTSEFSESAALRQLDYLNIPLLDLTAPTQEELHKSVDFISRRILNGKVYVHCKIGYSRSAAAVGSYLVASGHADDADDAIAMLRAARPSIVIRPEALAAIHGFKP